MRTVQSESHVTFGLRASGVTKVFGDTVALWRVDLEARSGDLLALHGANGSGKTTLLRLLAGLVVPTRGEVHWTTGRPGMQPRVGLLSHANHLFDDLTAIENVTLAARLARRDDTRALDLLGELGIASSAARRAGDLSSGTRRRVGLARLLASDPEVVLVDEPFAGLDESAADLVWRALRRRHESGRLMVIATHDDARVASLATTTVWLESGRVRQPSAAGTAAAS